VPTNTISTFPKVSVIIPAYNSETFIKDSIQSVINQDYQNIEIICVDDGSTDNTKNQVMNNFPCVLYFYQENKGPAAARNLGIKKSTGEYIAFLDSDDVWLPEKISMQMEKIFRNPKITIIHTNINIKMNGQIRDTAYPTDHQEGKIFENLLLQNGSVVCSTLLVKKECIEKVGYFDEELRTSEDVHLLLRLAYYYDFYFLNKVLVIKNHHGSNLTNLNNIYYGAGTILALEKIELLFPQYSRGNSKVMRRAFSLRARLKASGYVQKGDYKNALLFLIKALNYQKTFLNFLSITNQIMKMCYSRVIK
jgi:glycosyltransferase involved in cell wall biosynthesis